MLVCRRCFLGQAQASLLLLFNGFTPTATLLQMTARPSEQASCVLNELERRGWIERVRDCHATLGGRLSNVIPGKPQDNQVQNLSAPLIFLRAFRQSSAVRH